MAYRRGYEDSYLDQEDEEFDGSDKTDAERIIELLEKPVRTAAEDKRIQKLTERLFTGAKLPGPPGEQAVYGIGMVAKAYVDLGMADKAALLWGRLSDIAEITGNRELYYKTMDAMAELSEATYEEHHRDAAE